MKHPKVTVTIEMLPIFPLNMRKEDRTEKRYIEIMKDRIEKTMNSGMPILSVNQVYMSTFKAEFPEDWNV